MNRFTFLYKFFINKQYKGKFNWNLLFPFMGIIIGCVTVALTLAIMEGIEFTIYEKLKSISFEAKLTNIHQDLYSVVDKFLIENKINYLKGAEDQVLIIKDSDFRLVTIHAIEEFHNVANHMFHNDLEEIKIDTDYPVIYLGRHLAIKLDVSLGDTILIADPKKINIMTGLPQNRSMILGGIYELKILDYDHKHVFTKYKSVKNLLSKKRELYYLTKMPNSILKNNIFKSFPNISLLTWENENKTFISAMKLEKIIYALSGFLIIGIAAFTLMTMMSLSVMQKVPQIGILRSLGADKQSIRCIFIFQALITWLISSCLGVLISLIIIEYDKKYHYIKILFPESLFFDFPLILNNLYIFLIFFVSLILLLIAAIYPAFKAANINIVSAIGYKR